ncbi:hypothetical protein [Salsipaludibacter albus]|uniref:hypothetical protein n=1 Tax=Salsipaludibacter albus TaxID=2849650 RepID=UPI001EE48905|nr:hypothetical protein [Salsipaludibacter albus]MBY5164110.1 hypothetical protein [Salsipaludibacter albus]
MGASRIARVMGIVAVLGPGLLVTSGCASPGSTPLATVAETTAQDPAFDRDACPDGVFGEHSDWIEEYAFDSPEEAAAEQPSEAPAGERVLVESGEERKVFVIVAESGETVGELVAERRSDDRWAVFDYQWCK